MHLVPFGEYVPLKSIFFFVGPIIEAVSAFYPGTEHTILPVGNHKVSTAICYEVIYASLIRRFVLEGSELLTTITNDAWYGWSSAAYQHWDQAALRAIEGGRYLARAANTGISGFVDPYGRVLQKSELFEQRTMVEDLRFLTWRRSAVKLKCIVCDCGRSATDDPPSRFARRRPRTTNYEPRITNHEPRHHHMAIQLDEQLRRYEDLARRAGDLRSYL
jgi:hypothetical protein